MESAQGNILQGKTNIESVREVFGLLVLKPSLLASKPTMLQTSTQCYKQICQKCAISGLQHWGLANHWRGFAFGSSCYFKGLMMTPSFMGFKKRKDAARCLQHCILASFHPLFYLREEGDMHHGWISLVLCIVSLSSDMAEAIEASISAMNASNWRNVRWARRGKGKWLQVALQCYKFGRVIWSFCIH